MKLNARKQRNQAPIDLDKSFFEENPIEFENEFKIEIENDFSTEKVFWLSKLNEDNLKMEKMLCVRVATVYCFAFLYIN
jgi:hypothetical protein